MLMIVFFSGGSPLANGIISAKNSVICFNGSSNSFNANGTAKKLKITSDDTPTAGAIQVTALLLDLTNFVPGDF